MSDSDKGGLTALALIVAASLGYGVYSAYKKENDQKKRARLIEEKFKEFNCEELLDPENKLHRGLMNTVNELRTMLLDSITKTEKTPAFRYPIAAGMLMRSSVEQALKVYIDGNGGIVDKYNAYKNKETMAGILKDKNDEKSRKLLKDLMYLMNQDVRTELNDVVHSPEDLEKIEKTISKLSLATPLLEFVKDAAEMARQENVSS